MNEATAFAVLLGVRLRSRRRELGFPQDEVARRAGMFGFAATRSVVDAIERGMRKLDVIELIAMLAALGLTFDALHGGETVALDGGISIDLDALLSYARGESNTMTVRKGSASFVVNPATGTAVARGESSAPLRSFVGAYSDAEMKAARRLGIDPPLVLESADKLWGRSLAEERDERVRLQAGMDATPRSIQALRGHVTRALLEELRATLEPADTDSPSQRSSRALRAAS